MSWNSTRFFIEYLINTGANKYQRGATRWAQPTWVRQEAQARPGGCCPPRPTSGAHLLVYKSFWPTIMKGRTFGTKCRCLEAELGQEHFFPLAERFRWENFPPGGGNHRHYHHQQLSHLWEGNLRQHLQQHYLLSNTSSYLVFNLCTRTLDWYLRGTSSVDYIL